MKLKNSFFSQGMFRALSELLSIGVDVDTTIQLSELTVAIEDANKAVSKALKAIIERLKKDITTEISRDAKKDTDEAEITRLVNKRVDEELPDKLREFDEKEKDYKDIKKITIKKANIDKEAKLSGMAVFTLRDVVEII